LSTSCATAGRSYRGIKVKGVSEGNRIGGSILIQAHPIDIPQQRISPRPSTDIGVVDAVSDVVEVAAARPAAARALEGGVVLVAGVAVAVADGGVVVAKSHRINIAARTVPRKPRAVLHELLLRVRVGVATHRQHLPPLAVHPEINRIARIHIPIRVGVIMPTHPMIHAAVRILGDERVRARARHLNQTPERILNIFITLVVAGEGIVVCPVAIDIPPGQLVGSVGEGDGPRY